MFKKSILIAFVMFTSSVVGQTDSTKHFTLSAYAEAYYSVVLNKNAVDEKPVFYYNYKQNNTAQLNLAFVKAAYLKNSIRGNLALMTGDYAKYNLANESGIAQHVLEANIGLKLSTKQNIWIDIGVLPSHIGFESAIGGDCYNLSRSLVAENSPYFETGLKLSGTSTNKKFNWALLWLNGWQKIGVPENFSPLNLGMQFNYAINKKLTINYSNFIGSDKPKPNNFLRTYHNLYAQFSASSKTSLIVGLDVGTDKNELGKKGVWISPVLMAKHTFNTVFSLASRIEYVKDKQAVFYSHTNQNFRVWGLSTNVDVAFAKWGLLRTEIRLLKANSRQSVAFQSSYQQWINSVLILRWN